MRIHSLPLVMALVATVVACAHRQPVTADPAMASIARAYDPPELFPFPLVAIAAGDFDHDGHTDVALVDAAADAVLIRFNNGQTDFDVRPTLSISVGKSPVDIAAEDFNLDGLTDLAVACEGSSQVWILMNNPAQPASFSVSNVAVDAPSRLAVGRLTPDGDPDIAAASRSIKTITVLVNNGGSFAAQAPIGHPHVGIDNSIIAIDIGDIDNDKDIQEITAIAVVQGSAPARGRAITFFLAQGGPPVSVARSESHDLPAGYTPVDGVLHDADNDPGHLEDLLVACTGADAVIYLPNGGFDANGKWQGFSTHELYPLSGAGAPASIAAASLAPNDNYADAAILLPVPARLSFLRNNPQGNPRFVLEPSVVAPPGARVVVADLNNDSKPDLVFPGGFILAK